MVIPSLGAAEIEMAKNLLKVTSWTNYKRFALFFFAILVLHNCSYLVVFVFRARKPHIDGYMKPRTWRTHDSSRKYATKISKFHVFRCDHVPSSKATRASYTGYVHNKSIGIATSQRSPRYPPGYSRYIFLQMPILEFGGGGKRKKILYDTNEVSYRKRHR